ncbi:protein sneaky [Coccinella septempunctata]|uniref:protein sneaky n=1 Tax=Coccinella septempunctata TaxID=41139 RepID=UPI001D07E379|nr:protein sneaky [Coccinella septempunctata]
MKLFKILFQTRTHKYRKTKALFGFLYGLLLGLGFYGLILTDLNFLPWSAIICGILISLMLAFGIALSSQIRCIAFISLPVFAGESGKGVQYALILFMVIAGPLENLATNGKEVVRVFACSASLTFNLTKTRFELMFKPFTQALFGMKTEVNEVKDTLRTIKDLSAPITGEIEDEKEMKKLREENDYLDNLQGDTKRSAEIDDKYLTKGEQIEAARYEEKYLEKVELRCNKQFSTAALRCRNMFQSTYDKCYDAVTWAAAWLLCWPMKLDFVCNIAQALGGTNRCDPTSEIDPGLGEGYEYLKKSRVSLTKNFKNVKLQYKLSKVRHLINLQDTADTAKAIEHDVNEKKKMLDMIFISLKRMLAFVLLYIIVKSQNYHDQFLRNIEYDNVYITKYFRKIDARRKGLGKTVLFPLKKFEKTKLVDLWSRRYLKSERKHLLMQGFILILEIIFISTFILIDRLFYEALDLVRRHAKIQYTQVGHHDLLLEIKGTGMIASLLRSIVKGFNVKKRIKMTRSNEICLPHPTPMPNIYFLEIYGMFFLIAVMMFIEVYTNRLKSVICGYIYRKRQKRRILYLYNETTRRRIGFLRYMKTQIIKKVRERRLNESINVCIVARIRYPKCCGFLKIFGIARRNCIICEEPEAVFDSLGKFYICKNFDCHLLYCAECWLDIGEECLACSTIEAESSNPEDESGYED